MSLESLFKKKKKKKRRNAFEPFHIESIEKVRIEFEIEFVRKEICEEWKKQFREDEAHLVQNSNPLQVIPMEDEFVVVDERFEQEDRREKQVDDDDDTSIEEMNEQEVHLLTQVFVILTDEDEDILPTPLTNNALQSDK